MYYFLWICLVFVTVRSQLMNSTVGEISSSPCTDAKHLLLAPGVLAAGSGNRVCVSRFHTDGPARLILSLDTKTSQTVTAYRELPPGDGGCLDISVPQVPNSKADLVVNIAYPEARCTWERRITLRVSGSRVVVINTERPKYRAAETLRFRIIVLKSDLTPAHGSIQEVWLEGPQGSIEGARLMQWMDVRTRLGIVQLSYQIDESPPIGKWAVRARLADGSQGSATFHVGNYELPPFQMTVRHAAKVLKTSERLVWTVCVRYPWTEAVEGMLVIRLRGAGADEGGGGSYSGGRSAGIMGGVTAGGVRTAVRLRAPRACHRHAIAARRVGLSSLHPPQVIIADFSFQEDGTRVWQNTTVVSQVVDKHLSLEFLMKQHSSIASGLPQKLKVKATRWDEKPGSNERIRVCRSQSTAVSQPELRTSLVPEPDVCAEGITDDKGIARVLFTADEVPSPYYNFKASLANDSSISAAASVPSRGESRAGLGGIRDPRGDRTFVPLYLNMNVTRAITVHFVVITRGGIIHRWGATTQCPITNTANQIETANRGSLCHNSNLDYTYYKLDMATLNTYSNASDALLDRHLKKIMLPVKVTPQMCPDSHLIAYFYYNGELISASKRFEFDDCFANKVDLTWQSRQTAPGSFVSIQLTTPGPALCGLTAIDMAAKWNSPMETVKDVLMKNLKRIIDSHRNLTEFDAAGECFLTDEDFQGPLNNKEWTESWLAAAGVRLLGGSNTRRRCMQPVPDQMQEEDVVPRTDFSEAWLWRLVPVSGGGVQASARAPGSVTRHEARAVCVARNGIAISQPALLQVFQDFFIHADGPNRLKRGDESIVRYRIFNYLYENLSVQIQIIPDGHLTTSSESVESSCIPPRSSISRRLHITAKEAGAATLNIRAKAVHDQKCGNISNSGASDEIQIKIQIDHEGRQIRDERSILLCAEGSPESSTSKVSWSWPAVQAVPGTESITVWAIGDMVGPLLADADALVTLPRGCGEQNLARLATNLLALQQLHPDCAAATIAKTHVARGFTRQLQYAHASGGFSAFGESDSMPSTWLTAFAVRYMRRAHQVLTPSLPVPPTVQRAEQWLINQQMENGCFRNDGQVFHRELKGGLSEDGETASVALTAYVITSLLDSLVPLSSKLVSNTLACLRALPPSKTKSPNRIYAQALLSYAFMRLRTYEDDLRRTNEASLLSMEALKENEEVGELVDLLALTKRTEDLLWWETGSLSTTIEATSYGLLALSQCAVRGDGGAQVLGASGGCADAARAAARWLARHRNAAGGFLSTQDTLVALEALIAWKSAQPTIPANLTVTALSDRKVTTVKLHPDVHIPEVMKMGIGNQVDVSVEGSGCALVQATRFYNSAGAAPAGVRGRRLAAQVSVTTDGAFDCENNTTFCFCAAVVQACVSWTGEFPEMALLEVLLPGGYGADASLLYDQLHQTNSLVKRIELSASNSRATFYLRQEDGAWSGRHACVEVHAVGPQAVTSHAHVSVTDYYNTDVNHTQTYTIPEDCPPRIISENKHYLHSDNLFTKAKSLSNGELVITDEFTFEDIPAGLPLEDPLYDNLTQTDDEEEKRKPKDVKLEVDFIDDQDKMKENNEKEGDKKLVDNEIPKTDLNPTHKLEVRDDNLQRNEGVDNPKLNNFHVINSEKDLEVPPGIEGPVPAVVLPPKGFKSPDFTKERGFVLPQYDFSYYKQFRDYVNPVYSRLNY